MPYPHDAPVFVRFPDNSWESGRIDDRLEPAERRNMPPDHQCVRFDAGGRLLVAESDMQLVPERIR